jgi:hypothetical protein
MKNIDVCHGCEIFIWDILDFTWSSKSSIDNGDTDINIFNFRGKNLSILTQLSELAEITNDIVG